MIEFRADTKKTAADLSRMRDIIGAGLRRELDRAGALHQRAMVKRFVSYGSGDPIQTRSGALRRAFGWAVRGDGLNSMLRVFAAGLPYTRAQEYGGTIKPRNKRFLTIPLRDALTPSGVLKGGARLLQRGKRWVTADGAPTVLFRSKGGQALIGDFKGRGNARVLRLLYVLKPSVRLRPRLGFREVFRRETLPALQARLRRIA